MGNQERCNGFFCFILAMKKRFIKLVWVFDDIDCVLLFYLLLY